MYIGSLGDTVSSWRHTKNILFLMGAVMMLVRMTIETIKIIELRKTRNKLSITKKIPFFISEPPAGIQVCTLSCRRLSDKAFSDVRAGGPGGSRAAADKESGDGIYAGGYEM